MTTTGRRPRIRFKITLATATAEALTAKAAARGMTVEGLIGETLDLAEREKRRTS